MSDWRDEGLCTDPAYSAEDWFPIGDGEASTAQAEAAKAICRTCPVVVICAAWALETRQPHGVWGALSERDRERIWRAQSRQATRERQRPPTPHEKAVTARAALAPILAEYAADTEARVRRLTVAGMSLTQIAQRMNISPRQVGRYRARLRAGVA